jgi:hypothetical protein
MKRFTVRGAVKLRVTADDEKTALEIARSRVHVDLMNVGETTTFVVSDVVEVEKPPILKAIEDGAQQPA